MKPLLTILALWLLTLTAGAQQVTFTWQPSIGPLPISYVLMHSPCGQFNEWWDAGSATNYTCAPTWAAGNNYFTVVAESWDGTNLWISSPSNVVIVSNTPSLNITVMMSNDMTYWKPWATNAFSFPCTEPAQFFNILANRTNQLKVISVTQP